MSPATVMRHRNRAQELIGARLAAAGITEMPAAWDEGWTAILAPIADEAIRRLRRDAGA
jgi:hypothetical protein